MKKLPEKWCIKLDRDEVVDYCNKYGKLPPYNICETYAHFPPYQQGCTTSADIKLGYTEITFKQFKKLVLKEKEPMKTYSLKELVGNKDVVVFLENREQWQKLHDTKMFNLCASYEGAWCYALFIGSYSSSSSPNNVGIYKKDYPNIKVIQFNQIDFTQMEEKKIIGWKLKNKEYSEAALSIAKANSWRGSNGNDMDEGCIAEQYLNSAGVLELWFSPVYEKLVPKIEIKGYVAEFLPKDEVKFECQTYTKEFIAQLNETLIVNDFTLLYNGKSINPEINKLAVYLQKC